MPTERASLLPPNATRLERAFEAAAARVDDVPAPLAPLWDPATIPAETLPFLAWGLSVDSWDPDWSEAVKREAVAQSIELHRLKGTPAAVDAVLASFDELLEIVEWHETVPRGQPHTFEITLPLVTPDGIAPGGPRSRAAFADAIVREVSRVKPLREHMKMVQKLATEAFIGLVGAAQVTRFDRFDGVVADDPSPEWLDYLQTEDGEPMQAETGDFLEDVA